MSKLPILVVAAALAAPALAADPAALFSARCAVCHGKDGKGSPAGKKMGVSDLSGERKEPVAEIAKDISDGKGKMPPFKGKLSPAEIDALAQYVKAGLK